MRRPSTVVLLSLAACWLVAGPGDTTTRALLACRHHAMDHAGRHHTAPADGPCFCGEMTGGLDLAVSTAVPAPPAASAVVVTLERAVLYQSLFPLPPSPTFSPIRPPPNRLG